MNKMEENKAVKTEELTPFLESGECWDKVTFEFDDGKKLYVSQNLLLLASPVFKTMFEHDFEEKRTKTVKLVDKKFDDMLEFLKCLHPNIQKPVTFENVFTISSIAEEYQCSLITNRCKERMSAYLKFTITNVGETSSQVDIYECALSCLKLLVKAYELNYDKLLSEAVDVIAQLNFKYFTGTIRNTTQGPRFGQKVNSFQFGGSPVMPSTGIEFLQQPTISKRCVEDVAKDCGELYESLSEKMKNRLLLRRLCSTDHIDIGTTCI